MHQVTTELEQQRALIKSINSEEERRKTNAESLARVKEQVSELGISQFLLPAQAAAEKQKQVFAAQAADQGLTGARATAYIASQYAPYAPYYQKLAAPQLREQAEKLERQRLEGQQSIQAELGRTRLAGVTPVDIRQLGTGGVTRPDVERDIVAQYQQRVEIAHQTYAIETDLIINKRHVEAADTVGLAQKQRDLESKAGKERITDAQAAMGIKKEAYELDKRERDLDPAARGEHVEDRAWTTARRASSTRRIWRARARNCASRATPRRLASPRTTASRCNWRT